MSILQEIGILIIQTLASLYLLVVLLRFLLQIVRADFYNPLSQFTVRATNPILIPVRRVVPGVFGIDLASLVIAVAFQFVVIELSALILTGGFFNPIDTLLWGVIGTVSMVVNIFYVALVVMIIASFVAPQSHHPALLLINQLVEPIIAPFRKRMPDLGGFDISPIFVFLAIHIVRIIIEAIAISAGVFATKFSTAGVSFNVSQLVLGI